MSTQNDRPAHLQGLTDGQGTLYYQMIEQVSATGTDYWTTLRGLDASAADKYALADALGDIPARHEYAAQAGIDPQGGKIDMITLGRGERFIGPDERTVYEVTTPASEHERGWVNVRNVSMTDEQAAELLAEPGAVEPGCDPRDGFFAYSYPTYVERVDQAQTAAVCDRHDDRAAAEPPTASTDADDAADGW